MEAYRSQLIKIGWITLTWTIISLFQFFIRYGALVEYGVADQFNLLIPLKASLIAGVMAGVLGGSATVFLWEKWLRSKPYGWTIRNTLISYSIIFILVASVTTAFFQSQLLSLPPYEPEVLNTVLQRLTSTTTLVPFFTWLSVSVITVIALQVNDKYGPGVFRKFLLGRYFNPKREERIFMFLDLRSSTTIAEEIGEERYFSFLREVFRFATPAILSNEGEIYQYVGDEIVISWELDRGKRDAHCINCYFDIQEVLNKKKHYFQENYGNQPEFKAGIHYGHVMAGEIGIVKREIAFSGDVLNTAARIQSMCNELGVNILTSKAIIDLLGPVTQFKPEEVGAIELRGKKETVTLFTI
ncbi:MAG: adenylate/guanylate cyclase domain-containing protein [Bacteroidota bacterium]